MRLDLHVAAALWLGASSAALAAEAYPTKPVRVVVGFPAGSANDFIARTIGQRLGERYGQQIVIDNRPGAGALIATQIVANAVPDGYTLALAGQSHVANALLRVPPPYDLFRDFSSVALVATVPNVIVLGNSVPVKSVTELIALAKAKPGHLNFASGGVGSASHLGGELMLAVAGIKAVHVPFKAFSDIFTEAMSGRVHFFVFPVAAAMPMIGEGRLRAIAVASTARLPSLPDVPTTAEAKFPEFVYEVWNGIVTPAGVPKQLIAKISRDIAAVLQQKDVQERLERQGAQARYLSAGEFEKLQRSEHARLGKLIAQLGIAGKQ